MLFGLTYYLPEAVLTVGDNLEFLIRILVVELFGFLIGLERSKRQKDAGIRTHCIIAVTSTVIMILSKYCFVDLVDLGIAGRNSDPGRMATQVVSGISFLGAGVIFRDRNSSSIKGLTTILRRRGMLDSPAGPDPLMAFMKKVSARSLAVCAVRKRAAERGTPTSRPRSRT